MITKFGWTPGKLLCGIRVKDANTLENVSLMQATIRCVIRKVGLLIIYLSTWWSGALIILIILAVFDKRKQFFHDKIVNTIVIDCKPAS